MDILGIGECMIELDGAASLAYSSTFTRQVGGDIYNTLVACSRLGSSGAFVTRIAMDGFGQVLLKHFEEHQIDTRFVQQTHDGLNGLYFATLDTQGNHEFVYYRQQSAASQLQPSAITPQMIQQANIVYASGITQALSESSRKAVLKAFQLAKQHGKVVAYDVNYRPNLWKHRDQALEALVEVLPYLDVILPSEDDLQRLFQFEDIPHMLEYFRLRGVPIVALKRGEAGVILGSKHQSETIPAVPANVTKDTIGAGDAFNGGFLHGLIQHRSLVECAQLGAVVSSLSLRETGPIRGLPTMSEVETVLKGGQIKQEPVTSSGTPGFIA